MKMELIATLLHLIIYFLLYPSTSSKCLPNLELSQSHVTATAYTDVNCTITCPKSHITSLQWKTIDGTVITASALGARTRALSPYTLQLEISNRNLGTQYQCVEKYSGIQTWLHLCGNPFSHLSRGYNISILPVSDQSQNNSACIVKGHSENKGLEVYIVSLCSGTTSKDCDKQGHVQHRSRNERDTAKTSDSKNDTEPFVGDEAHTTTEITSIATSTTVFTAITSNYTDKTQIENPSITTATQDLNNTRTNKNEDKTTTVNHPTTDAPILNKSETRKGAGKTTTENKIVTSKIIDLSSTKSEALSTKTQKTSTVTTTTKSELKTVKDIRSNSNITANSNEDITIAVETDLSRKYAVAMNTSRLDGLDPVEPIDKIHSETTDFETFKTKAIDQNPSSTPSFHKTFTEKDTTIDAGSETINFDNAKSTKSTNVLTKSISTTPETKMGVSADETVPALEASVNFPLLAEGPPLKESPVNLEGDTTVQESESTITTTPMFTLIAINPTDSLIESTEGQASTRQPLVKHTLMNNVTEAGEYTTITAAQTTSEGITITTETETKSQTQTAKTSYETKQIVDTTASLKTTKTTGGGGEASDVTTDMLTQTNKLKTTTRTKDNGSSNKSEGADEKVSDSDDSMFGKYGLPMFAAAVALALILLFVVIYLCLKQKRRGKAKDFMTSEKNAPKLKMLEVRSPSLTGELKSSKAAPKDDGLQTYSLDYEKHVQQKIEEHRQLVKRKSLNSSLTAPDSQPGVSSFKIPRKPSAESGRKGSRSGSQSGPNSPVTPTSPEGKPLLPKEDEPVVFNFAKKPGEATAARRGSALDAVIGQRPNSGNPKKTTKPDDDYV